jgi:hypothetical protein
VWLQTGYGLVNGFTDHLYTQLVTTSNYSATGNLHNSQITTAPAKPFPDCCVFTTHSLECLLTVEILQLHTLTSSCHRRLCRTQLSYTAISFQLLLQSSNDWLPQSHFSRCMHNQCHGNVFTKPLPRNGSDITIHLTIIAYQRLYIYTYTHTRLTNSSFICLITRQHKIYIIFHILFAFCKEKQWL